MTPGAAMAISMALAAALTTALTVARWLRASRRRRRQRVRLEVIPYRTDRASIADLIACYEALHKRLLRSPWTRLTADPPMIALEAHLLAGGTTAPRAALAVTCDPGDQAGVQSALRTAYPNVRVRPAAFAPDAGAALIRLRKAGPFIDRLRVPEPAEERRPLMDRLLTTMASVAMTTTTANPAYVQLSLRPAPPAMNRRARRARRLRSAALVRRADQAGATPHASPGHAEKASIAAPSDRLCHEHEALFHADLRVGAVTSALARQIASELCAESAQNRLIARGTRWRHGALGLYAKRIARGETRPLPGRRRDIYAAGELAALWHLPSVEFVAVPFERAPIPVAPAGPAIARPSGARGLLTDALGPVTIEPALRCQNTAVPGTVAQGKTSYLVATIEEDLARPRCAVIVLDPKGDAADAAISLVPGDRRCTVLDLARPTCGFNPLTADAPPDTVADGVVAALRGLFAEGDIRASSDRYLRNAIIATLAHDPAATLWDVARLLSVSAEGSAYREHVSADLLGRPQYAEVIEFFADELSLQLLDARSTTTTKLDAPANKLARLLNSPSIKRTLMNRSLVLDLGSIVSAGEVLIVRGALGEIGAENTAVMMQLLVASLDATLARQQDRVREQDRVTVALKIDEAPLCINRAFARTLALKRSAGLETVACWQTDAQWQDPELRDQLDALFAHRVYFATASAQDARAAAGLLMADYTDQLRAQDGAALAHPDVRLHLPRHWALASWTTSAGRQPPFVARTRPLTVDRARIAHHTRAQFERGGRSLVDLRGAPRRPEPSNQIHKAAPPPKEPAADVEPAPGPPPASLAELACVDAATGVRLDRAPPAALEREPEPVERAIVAWIAEMGCVLSSQVHAHLAEGRSLSTTQRQLRRLWEAGWVRRFALHGADGGIAPMAYAVSSAGFELLEHTRSPIDLREPQDLLAARRAIHATAWILGLQRASSWNLLRLRGRAASQCKPALPGRERVPALRAAELQLPAGRHLHGFRHTSAGGPRTAVERFEPVRPDAAVELALQRAGANGRARTELLVDFERSCARPRSARKVERYDHFLAGWWQTLSRNRESGPPLVVLVCPDGETARDLCRLADALVTCAHAHARERREDWPYPGRARLRFAAEADVHRGQLRALALPALPPEVRADTRVGGSRACEPIAVSLPD